MLQRRGRRAGEAGFTLVELLIVIIILGILAGITVFAISSFSGQGAKEACKTDVRSVETAVEAYKNKNGAYPSASPASGAASDDARMGQLAATPNPILKRTPSSNEYKITITGNGGEVQAQGPGGSGTPPPGCS